MTNQLDAVYEELLEVYHDLKAEIVVSEVEEKTSIAEDSIITLNQSTFNRSYRRDIAEVKLVQYQKNKDALQLDLSRNGIYDLLPEGVFHKIDTKRSSTSFASIRKQQKKEEHDARLLLAPIENELFRQRVDIEKKEKSIIKNFSNLEDRFLIDFWKIDKSIPKKYAIKLVRLLPYAHQISGNLELVFLSLKKILGVDVNYKKTFESKKVNIGGESEGRLGQDFVLDQETLIIQQPVLNVEIQLKKKSDVAHFLGEKGILNFVDIFYKFFIPIEYMVKTEIELKQEKEFILDKEVGAYLGMSTRI